MNCWPSGKYVHLLYMYSILGRGSFCFNYCLNSAWHGGDQFVALLRWYGSPGFFDSGLQLICIVGSGVSHLPLDNNVVQVRRVCWPIKHSNTMVIEPAFGTFGSVGRCQVLLENEISISINLSAEGSMKCSKISGRWLRWLWTSENTVDQHQQMTWQPNHHWLWKLHTGLQATWILCLSTLPPDSGTLFPNEMQNLLSSEKRTLDHWVIFLHSQVRRFWRCLWFRSGLVALFLKTSECGDSWCTDSSFSPLLVKLSKCLNQLCLTVFSSLRSSLLLVHLFLPKFFLPVNFAFNMLWYSTL